MHSSLLLATSLLASAASDGGVYELEGGEFASGAAVEIAGASGGATVALNQTPLAGVTIAAAHDGQAARLRYKLEEGFAVVNVSLDGADPTPVLLAPTGDGWGNVEVSPPALLQGTHYIELGYEGTDGTPLLGDAIGVCDPGVCDGCDVDMLTQAKIWKAGEEEPSVPLLPLPFGKLTNWTIGTVVRASVGTYKYRRVVIEKVLVYDVEPGECANRPIDPNASEWEPCLMECVQATEEACNVHAGIFVRVYPGWGERGGFTGSDITGSEPGNVPNNGKSGTVPDTGNLYIVFMDGDDAGCGAINETWMHFEAGAHVSLQYVCTPCSYSE